MILEEPSVLQTVTESLLLAVSRDAASTFLVFEYFFHFIPATILGAGSALVVWG